MAPATSPHRLRHVAAALSGHPGRRGHGSPALRLCVSGRPRGTREHRRPAHVVAQNSHGPGAAYPGRLVIPSTRSATPYGPYGLRHRPGPHLRVRGDTILRSPRGYARHRVRHRHAQPCPATVSSPFSEAASVTDMLTPNKSAVVGSGIDDGPVGAGDGEPRERCGADRQQRHDPHLNVLNRGESARNAVRL